MPFYIKHNNKFFAGEGALGASFTPDIRDAKQFERRSEALRVCGSFGFSMGDVVEIESERITAEDLFFAPENHTGRRVSYEKI